MCGPHHCLGRDASASDSAIVRTLLQSCFITPICLCDWREEVLLIWMRSRGVIWVLPRATNVEGPASLPGLLLLSSEQLDLEIHTTHPAHAAARRHAASAALVLLGHFGHHSFSGDQESRNRGCVLEC